MTPNIKPPSDIICLHRAAAQNNYKAVRNLIDLGADVNAICHYPPQKFNYNANCTALHVAVANGSKRIVELLIKNDANVNIEANCEDEDGKYSGIKEYFNRTPLLIAIDQGNREIVELLIRNDADINFTTTAGESAFGLALKNDNDELIQLLLDAGVDVNLHSNNVTSLHWAVARNNYPIAEYLINKGADVNTVCHYPPRECFNTCCSALHVAVKNKNKDMIELLLKNNADVNIKANCDETTPCHFPVRDYFNRTPLHIAVDKEDKEVVKLLIKNKADVNIGTRTGETALGIAVKKNNFTLVKFLLDADAEINSTNESPLHLAMKQRHYKMAEYLLNRGADFNIRDFDGAVINLQCADEDTEVIKRHIVKLKAANLYIGSYLCEIGDGFDCLYEECYREIPVRI
ncbi:putative ankyrin repeat protein RF_0381 [Microplitis mediator]|uniref:putative ankyrin repeat protein RF_0381 n=1 Tax=Microplitis mediator TaxID=375433 RepID=UPI0025562355|nr:putative ankyrin repeat protein RF_0381 [Microplitis mediator]